MQLRSGCSIELPVKQELVSSHHYFAWLASGSKTNLSQKLDQNLPQNTKELFDKYFNSTIGEDDLLSIYPWISEILNSKTPVIRNSPFQYEPLGAILGFNSDYSAIGAPLFINDQPIGIIVLVHHLPDQYDNESQSLASAFANHASIAIENIQAIRSCS